MTPYYDEDGITIYHCDARAVLPTLEGVPCLVTSPPYNVGIEYADHHDVMPWPEYQRLATEVIGAAARAMAEGGRLWINVAPVVQSEPGGAGRNHGPHSGRSLKERMNLALLWATAMEDAGLSPADIIAWCSQRGSGTAWGSYEMPSAPNVRGDWEALLWYFKGTFPRTPPADMLGWRDKIGGWPSLVSNVWTIRPEMRDGHPAPYPVELAERCIRLSTWPGEVVLDPFMGGGSTLVAAKNLSRRAIGVDVSEQYCEQAVARLAQGALDFGGAA